MGKVDLNRYFLGSDIFALFLKIYSNNFLITDTAMPMN